MILVRVAETGLKGDFSNSKGSGIQRYMYELYKDLRNRKEIKAEKVEVDFLGLQNGVSYGIGSMLKDFSSYDIVHNLDLKPFYPGKIGNAVIIGTAHDFYNLLAPELNAHLTSNLRGILWLKLSFKYALKSLFASNYIIAVSTLVKNDAIRLGYDSRNISVVNLGIDKRFISSLPKNKVKSHFTVGYIGSFATNKNITFAVKAFDFIKNDKIILKLYGKEKFEYRHLVGLAFKNRQISFGGFVPEESLVHTYDNFDAFVYPSLYDGFGIPIIEAQSRGLPVIIYKAGKIAKEVKKYCIEAEDEEHMAQIIQNIKNNGYNEKTKKKATEYARSFTWEKTADETVKVYLKYRK